MIMQTTFQCCVSFFAFIDAKLPPNATQQYNATVARLRRIRRRIETVKTVEVEYGEVLVRIWGACKCDMNSTLARRVTPP